MVASQMQVARGAVVERVARAVPEVRGGAWMRVSPGMRRWIATIWTVAGRVLPGRRAATMVDATDRVVPRETAGPRAMVREVRAAAVLEDPRAQLRLRLEIRPKPRAATVRFTRGLVPPEPSSSASSRC